MFYNHEERTIETDRLLLRLFKESDATEVSIMCNNYNIYKRMINEGTLKEHVYKDGIFEDLVYYGIMNPTNG